MSESYIEVMVSKKPSAALVAVKFLGYFLCGASFLLGCLAGGIASLALLVLAVALGFGAYCADINSNIEYEYLYLDKEITVDKIMKKTKRKRVASYSLEKIEIMAPLNSYRLDGFKNRQFKVTDVSSGIVSQPEKRYVFYYDGSEKVIFEPNQEFIKIVKNVSPRKIFND